MSLPQRFLDWFAARGFAYGTQCGREFVDIVIAWNILRLKMNFGDAFVIARC